MRRVAGLLALAGALAAVGAGCGGGSKELTHQEFVAKANTICKGYNTEIRALGTPASIEDVKTFAAKGQKITKKYIGQFKKLDPPPEDEANAKEYTALGDKVIENLKQLEDLAKKSDLAGVQRVGRGAAANAERAKQVGKAMGAAECAK